MEKPKAVVIGAGITGLAAAFWLDYAGWETTIVEKAPVIRDGGYLLGLTGLGYEAVKHMNIFPQLDAIDYKMEENVIRDSSGREIVRMRYKDAHGLESIALRRGDLAATLAAALPDSVHIRYGQTVADFADHGATVHVTLQSGHTLTADLLIGADGIHSSLRDKLFRGAPSPLHHLGYSYAVYDVEARDDLDSDCVSYSRPGHLDVFYRLRNRRLAALHLWRDDENDRKDGTAAYDRLRALAQGGHPQIAEIVARAEAAAAPVLLDALTMVQLPTWSQGRVLLLGDAAHCLTLMSGQGAAMAMASAEILGRELRQHHPDDVLRALANHDARLRPAIDRLQHHSRNLAAAYIPKTALGYHLRNLLLKLLPYAWLIAWHVKKVRAEIALTKLQ